MAGETMGARRTREAHAPVIAVVGAGLVGEKHARLAARLARLGAIVDPDPARAALAGELGARWFADLGDCLAHHRPDGVIVASPNHLHVAHGLACVSAGIPVLVEKPIAQDSTRALALVEAAEAARVPLLVGHHRRHNPIVAAARSAIAAGRIGEIVTVDARFWLYKPNDYFAPTWRRAAGAGPVFINLIHDVDLLRHLLGDIDSVQALESSRVRGFAVEDSAALLLRFQGGALGTVSVSDTVVAPWSWELTAAENPAYPATGESAYAIGGTEGALTLPDLALWRHRGARSWWEPIAPHRIEVAPADPLVRQLEHFVDLVRHGGAPLVDGREGLAALKVVEAVKEAAATGRPVDPRRPLTNASHASPAAHGRGEPGATGG